MKSNNPHPKPLCVIDRFHQLQTETESTGFRGTHKRRYGKTNTTKSVEKVSVTVDKIDGIAFATNNVIHIAAGCIERYRGDIEKEGNRREQGYDITAHFLHYRRISKTGLWRI
ncbi:hypothetical protein RYX36_021229 [Vicia faba]